MTVSVSDADLMERVCHLTNKIYREIIRIRMVDNTQAIGGLHNVSAFVGFFGFPFSPTSQYSSITLSQELLDWIMVEGRIPWSFANFFLSPESSGPLYISPDIYHTQITKYLLERFYQ